MRESECSRSASRGGLGGATLPPTPHPFSPLCPGRHTPCPLPRLESAPCARRGVIWGLLAGAKREEGEGGREGGRKGAATPPRRETTGLAGPACATAPRGAHTERETRDAAAAKETHTDRCCSCCCRGRRAQPFFERPVVRFWSPPPPRRAARNGGRRKGRRGLLRGQEKRSNRASEGV